MSHIQKSSEQGLAKFADALLDTSKAIPSDVINPDGKAATKRFDVYRNNIVISLIDALVDNFPIIQKLVGEEFFKAMAREYALSHPPTSPLMAVYGEDFPDFLTSFPPVATLPFLPDVARLETAWRVAYRAADVELISNDAFAQIEPHLLENTRLQLHPSVHLLKSNYAFHSIWQANNEGNIFTSIVGVQESVLLCRLGLNVNVIPLNFGEFDFLLSFQNGANLGQAAEVGMLASPEFDLTKSLTRLLGWQIIIAINNNQEQPYVPPT